MDTHPRYTLVGIVVVIILITLGLWVSWLWSGGTKEKTDFYSIYFRKQSLSGLQIDSIVTMRGIKIGSVKTVEIQPKDIERVRVTIALNPGTPVRTDTRAVIARNLLTGLAGIDLIGSTQSAPALDRPTQGDSYPVIEEGQTGLDQFQQSIPDLVGKASAVLERVSLLLSDDNVASLGRSIANIEKASQAMVQVDQLFTNANKSLTELSQVLVEAKGKVGPTLEEVSSTVREIKQALSGLSQELIILTKSLTTASQKLSEPRSSVLGLPSGTLGPGERAE